MIYYSIPYDLSKNIGKYYNQFMSMLPNDNDFACFLDGDATFTTHFFGKQLNDIVNTNLDIGIYTAYTNRVGCPWQKLKVNIKSNDIEYHRNIGLDRFNNFYNQCTDVTNQTIPMSGVLMLIRKKEWKHVGKFREKGMLGVDNDFHLKVRKNNLKIYRMDGVYLYHWWRNNICSDIKHLY